MKKRMGAILLILCLLVGLLPATALAGGPGMDASYDTFAEFQTAVAASTATPVYVSDCNFAWPTTPETLTVNRPIQVDEGSQTSLSWEIPANISLIFSGQGKIQSQGGFDSSLTICGTVTCPDYQHMPEFQLFSAHGDHNTLILSSGAKIKGGFYIADNLTCIVESGAEVSLDDTVMLGGTLTGEGGQVGTVDVNNTYSNWNGENHIAVLSGNLTVQGLEVSYSDTQDLSFDLNIPADSSIRITKSFSMSAFGQKQPKLSLNGTLALEAGYHSVGGSVVLGENGVLELHSGASLQAYNNQYPGQITGTGMIKAYADLDNGDRMPMLWDYTPIGQVISDRDSYTNLVANTVGIWCSWEDICPHQWTETSRTEATCTTAGEIRYTCSICSETKTEPIPATGHTWDEGTVTKQPTCTEPGEKTVTCTVCQATEQQEVPALGHDLAYTADGSTITEDCQRENCDHTATATLSATDGVYTGQAVENAQVNYSEGWAGGGLAITYSDNISAGEAAASITAGQATVRVTFQIDKAPAHTLTLGNLSQTSGNVSPVTCTVSPADSTAGVSVEYQVEGQWVSQPPTAVGSYPVRARVTESRNLVLADEEVYTTGTLTISQRSSGSSSGGSTSSGNKTETEKNPDGSTTTTVTKPNGTVTETTNRPDGSQKVVETRKDGTITTTTTDSSGNKTETVEKSDGSSQITVTNRDGSFSTTIVNEEGRAEAEVKLPASLIQAAADKDEAVALPMPSISASSNREDAPVVTVDLPADTSAKVEIPVANLTPGTVAVLVKADGTEQIIKNSLVTQTGVVVTFSDGDTVKIVENAKDFADVSGSYWGSDYIDFVTSREIFSGTGGNSFSPDLDMTRGMIVTVLAAYHGVDTSSTGGAWYEAGQKWAMEQGISDGTNMEQSLTREQLAVMLWRAAGSPSSYGLSGYTDGDEVSSWAQNAMAWAVQDGIVSGVDASSLAPRSTATRAQVAVMLMQFVNCTDA